MGLETKPYKRKRLCQALTNNGLGMIDLDSFVKSLKIKWVKRLIIGRGSTWRRFAPKMLQEDFVWNFGTEALQKQLKDITNPFWRDVVNAWISFSRAFVVPDDLVCYENIFNSDVTKFKAIRYGSWEKKGVKFIGDLFEDNKLMTWQTFKHKYNVPCIQFEYNALIRSLPEALKRERVNINYLQPGIPGRVQFLMKNNTFTRFFVKEAFRNEQRLGNDICRIENKWIRDMNVFEPLSVFDVHISVQASRYVSFQFRLIMRIITTNRFLQLVNLKESNKCTFCENSPETITHLFLTCNSVQPYWAEIGHFISRYGLRQLNDEIKIFGDKNSKLITHMMTLAKYVIYDSRRRSVRPSFNNFMAWLKRDYSSERYIAKKNGKNDSFHKKWNSIEAYFIAI